MMSFFNKNQNLLRFITSLLFFIGSGPSIAENEKSQFAVFAGGCFWCMEPPFEKVNGVNEVISGYAGGKEKSPTYKQVSSGITGHVEAVKVIYNPKKVKYKTLVDIFWRQIDPTDSGGQFVDRGFQYTTAIFYTNDEQKNVAEKTLQDLKNSKRFTKKIVTPIKEFTTFYPAEDYHQDYYKKNTIKYKFYRYRSGRDQYLEKAWNKKLPQNPSPQSEQKYKKPTQEELKKKLTDLQFKVTQKNETEPAFNNKYWNNKEPGIYVDITTGEPLFSSTDKYKSGTGWPSFTKPINETHIKTKVDNSWFMQRTEVRSNIGDAHLGHVFNDGPPPTNLRYCINSAALKFIPVKNLKKMGYEKYGPLFENSKK